MSSLPDGWSESSLEALRATVARQAEEIERLQDVLHTDERDAKIINLQVEIERLNAEFRAEITNEHAAYQELCRDLEAVCIDRDAQVDEVVRLRAVLEKIANSGNVHASWLAADALAALEAGR